jgi:hypothetical protein
MSDSQESDGIGKGAAGALVVGGAFKAAAMGMGAFGPIGAVIVGGGYLLAAVLYLDGGSDNSTPAGNDGPK